HVQGDRARRQAVLVELSDGPEIGGSEEGHPVVLAPVEVALPSLLEAKAREAGIVGQPPRRGIGGHVEILRVVEDFPRLAALHNMHPNRLLEVAPEMKEGDGELAGTVGPKRKLGLEPDLA